MGAFVGLIGLVCIVNGLMMLPSVESAMQQTVSAIYIVGGLLVLSCGLILIAMQDILRQLKTVPAVPERVPLPVPATERGEGVPPVAYMQRPVARGGWFCSGCGKENSPRIDVCSCGTPR